MIGKYFHVYHALNTMGLNTKAFPIFHIHLKRYRIFEYILTIRHLSFYSQQFFKHDFPVRHTSTAKRTTYRSCLVCDTCIRELIVLDVPLQVRTHKILSCSVQLSIDCWFWCHMAILLFVVRS